MNNDSNSLNLIHNNNKNARERDSEHYILIPFFKASKAKIKTF